MMSARATPRGLQRGHGHRTPGWVGGGVSVAAGQQPVDGDRVVRERDTVRITVGDLAHVARGEPDFVTDGFELGVDRPGTHACGRQQRHGGGMQQGTGFRADGHHVTDQPRTEFSATQQRMLLDQALRTIQGVGEQHGFERGVTTPGQVPQQMQQPLEPFRIGTQAVEKSCIGHFAGIQHPGRRGDRRQPVADGMCQSAEQLVMYREPSFGADVGLTNRAH